MSNRIIISRSDFVKNGEIDRKNEIFDGDIGCPAKVKADFKAVKISNDKVYVDGKVKGHFELECSRCLEKYSHPVEIKISADMDFLNGEIDLSEEMRQLLILELPMKPLCDKDCLGICKVCGKHNTKKDSCSCEIDDNKNFIRERWKELLNKTKRIKN